MTLNIFSFQRAFTAKKRMALAAGNCAGNKTSSLAAIEAKDILDSLYLGLDCEVMDCGEFCDASSSVDEFIDHCKTILNKLHDAENENITVHLPDHNDLTLLESNGSIQMKMDGEQVILPNLTIERLFNNLVRDIQNNPDLYGTYLASFAKGLKQREKLCALLLPAH